MSLSLSRKEFLLLIAVWLVATILNVTKPFHIDDAFHLEAAKYLADNPSSPSKGMINWDQTPEPLLSFNQPPLFFYLLALVGNWVNFSELPLHLLASVFTFLAIYFFYLTARLLKPRDAVWLTLLFSLGPAFLVNQNIMVDIPVLSMSLAFGFFLLKYYDDPKLKFLIPGGLFLGLALLIKYTVLPLLVIFIIPIIARKKYNHAIAVLIPLGMLALWSVWNYFDYGSIQVLTRNSGRDGLKGLPDNILNFMANYGAIAPFIPALAATVLDTGKRFLITVYSIGSLFVLFVLLSLGNIISAELSKEIIRYLFLLTGLFGAVIFIISFIRKHSENDIPDIKWEKKTFLVLWFGALALFVILFAPFMATRHLLLTLPPFLLIFPATKSSFSGSLKITSVVITAVLGITLSISDYRYARFYKLQANRIAHEYGSEPENIKIYSLGHWGWQHYSKENGMEIYSSCNSELKPGDLIVFPVEVPKQAICEGIEVKTIKKLWDNPGLLSFFSTRHEASFYQSGYKRPAWKLSHIANDTIIIQRVISNN